MPVPQDSPIVQFSPTPRELDDLELIASGALPGPVNAPGSPLTLTLPATVAEAAEASGAVEIVDPEGLPLAEVTWPSGEVRELARPAYGPFRRLYLTPDESRKAYAGRTVVPVVDILTETELRELDALGPVLLLALVGHGTPAMSAVGLIRATRLAAGHLADAEVVAVPLASHDDPEADHALGVSVVAAYAGGDPIHALELDEGAHAVPADINAVFEAEFPAPDEQGLVVFFTGLSGSGKSTLARALMDRILEAGERTVTSLDGDVVRRNLSAGLTFSKEDRETNIRRIGWVAAEISRHGGVAVCSPIAPFDSTRQDVRRYVEEAGGAFFLVHVATPLEECERRDRKGLYAKARAGEIPEFTGISSPYEEPADADVRVDTTGRTIDDALGDVVDGLREAGYLSLGETPDPLRVLFVCTGNIHRSPYAEYVARSLVTDGSIEFASAGTRGLDGSPADPEMLRVLPDVVDAGGHRGRALTPDMLADADLVLTMEAAQRTYILEEQPGLFRKVFTLGQAAEALARLDVTGSSPAEVVAALGAARGAADSALDVADPFRRGPAAAAASAEQISGYLETVLAALRGI